MIINAFAHQLEDGEIYISYLDERQDQYFVLPATRLAALTSFELSDIAGALFPAVDIRTEGDPGRRNLINHLKGIQRGKIVDHLIRPAKDRLDIIRKNTLRHFGNYAQERIPFDDAFRSGDVLCLLGSLWDQTQVHDIFGAYSQRGLKIYTFVHDLIPVLKPETVDVNPFIFHDWLKASTNYTDTYLTNSKNTAADLEMFLKKWGCQIPVHATPLAQAPIPNKLAASLAEAEQDGDDEYLRNARQTYPRRQDVREVVKLPFILNVGTIESRKNSFRQVWAWERMKHDTDMELPRLVFAGKRGWLNNDFYQAYRSTGGWGGRVCIVDKPSDKDLNFLYQRCEFTICTSIYEGWGLPIGEGLSYGKTGVVSNVSSMPEVGGNMVEYCDPYSVESIAEACRKLIKDKKHRKMLENRIAKTKLRSWADVADDIAKVITS